LKETDLDNFNKEEFTFSSRKATLEALMLMVPIGIGIATPYYLLWKNSFTADKVREFIIQNPLWIKYGTFIGLAVIIIGIVAHEIIHGVTWALFAKRGWQSIHFGIFWRSVTPYCHCSEILSVNHYMTGALMPALILSIFPSIISYITGNVFLFCFGFFFTLAAAGDFMIIKLLSEEDSDTLVMDHPEKVGYSIYRK
jgi:hypothetical protein